MISSRLSRLVWGLLIVLSAFGLYQVKYRVQAIQAEIAALNRQLEQEQEGLRVAAAEWAYLNQPERLQQLSARYLKLEPMQMPQIADIAAVPYPSQTLAQVPQTPGIIKASAPSEGE